MKKSIGAALAEMTTKPVPDVDTAAIAKFVLDKLEAYCKAEVRKPQEKVSGIRASMVSDCPRKIVYSLIGAEENPVGNADDFFNFAMGNKHHDLVEEILQKIFPSCKVEKRIRKDNVTGKFDGLITLKTSKGKFRVVIEIKGLKNETWTRCKLYGVKEATPYYYDQAQLYCHLHSADFVVFLIFNKGDSWKRYAECVARDDTHIKKLLTRIAKIKAHVANGTLPKRECVKSTDYRARRCPYRKVCFGLRK